MAGDTEDQCLPNGSLSLQEPEVLNTEVLLTSVGTQVQEYTYAPAPLYSGDSLHLGSGNP